MSLIPDAGIFSELCTKFSNLIENKKQIEIIIHILKPIFFAFQGTDLGQKTSFVYFCRELNYRKIIAYASNYFGQRKQFSLVFIWFVR